MCWKTLTVIAALAFGDVVYATPGVEVRTVEHLGQNYTVATIDLNETELHLYGQTKKYHAPKTFADLKAAMAADGLQLKLAMNAGMYKPNYRPVGLHIERGHLSAPIVIGASGGNFGMQPNAVFFVDHSGAHVVQSEQYSATTEQVVLATQ